MSRKKRSVIVDYTGKDLFILAGLPRDTLDDVKRYLSRDRSRTPSRYEGAPAATYDTKPLYSDNVIAIMVQQAAAFAEKGRDREPTTPRRVMALYVPSFDKEQFLKPFGLFAYVSPMLPLETEWQAQHSNDLAWRHDKEVVRKVVKRSIDAAIRITNALKAEVTDRRLTPLCLPARNFYYPDTKFPIGEIYSALVREGKISQSIAALKPGLFRKGQLHPKAFRSKRSSARYFQDHRHRVFPPDLYHAPARELSDDLKGSEASQNQVSKLPERIRVLTQRYRFGVLARDGSLHFDVQFESPRQLHNEEMSCSVKGRVLVSGSHANVGLNDSIWVPDGTKVSRPEAR
jgi:hypothetical protein